MSKKNIVIIEDDQAIREIITDLLSAEGYNCTGCDKLEPLADIARLKPDLIILDEWINDRGGNMLCYEIKKIHLLAHIPVVIISTSFNIEQIAVNCKADGFVRKPFEIETLLAEIKRCTGVAARHSSDIYSFSGRLK